MINSVIVPTASYFMQCLPFPKSVCNSLDKAVRNFLWDELESHRKLHLVGWDKIFLSKEEGGLGTPSFFQRNIAFFIKLCWRALSNPLDPRAAICNHRLSLKSCASSVLGKGLLLGNFVLKKHSFKIINSSNSKFWSDHWCHLGSIRSLINGPLLPHEPSLTVAEVCSGPRNWKWESVSFDFPKHILDSINATPVNLLSSKLDTSVWPLNLNGEFKLQDAYSLALDHFLASKKKVEKNIMKLRWIWSSPCHSRRRIFIWKIFMQGLPIKATLKARGINVCPLCPLCGLEYETAYHLFKTCPMIVMAWNELHCASNIVDHDDFCTWLKINITSNNISAVNIPHGCLFSYMLWNIWLIRNLKVFQNAPFLPTVIFAEAKRQAMEWFFFAGPSISLPSHDIKETLVSWSPPMQGWFKLNSNGSNQNSVNGVGQIYAGGIIRDCCGRWIKGYACPLGNGTSLLAELWAIFIGVQIAVEAGCLFLEIESDCLYTINLITDVYNHETHHYSPIIDACRIEVNKLRHVRIKHVLREGNCLADRLSMLVLLVIV